VKKLFKDFREFIARGNVVDLAVGIIIGSAFSNLVNSIVDNLLMPPFGLLLGNADFRDLFLILKQGEDSLPPNATLDMAREVGAVTFNYGQFITDVISFIFLALGVFLIIKSIQSIQAAVQKQENEAEPELSERDCPYCQKAISIKAKRCPYCTSGLTKTDGDEHA
jgi:large conductance mechanosensitive channel